MNGDDKIAEDIALRAFERVGGTFEDEIGLSGLPTFNEYRLRGHGGIVAARRASRDPLLEYI